MEPDSAGVDQQGHTAVHENTSSLCEMWDGHLERALRTTLNTERNKWLSISST